MPARTHVDEAGRLQRDVAFHTRMTCLTCTIVSSGRTPIGRSARTAGGASPGAIGLTRDGEGLSSADSTTSAASAKAPIADLSVEEFSAHLNTDDRWRHDLFCPSGVLCSSADAGTEGR